MRAKYGRTFEYGKRMAKISVICTAATCLAGLLLMPSGSSYQIATVVISFALLLATLYYMIRYCRCPYCGKRILAGVLTVTKCPACHRDLESGKKAKKK